MIPQFAKMERLSVVKGRPWQEMDGSLVRRAAVRHGLHRVSFRPDGRFAVTFEVCEHGSLACGVFSVVSLGTRRSLRAGVALAEAHDFNLSRFTFPATARSWLALWREDLAEERLFQRLQRRRSQMDPIEADAPAAVGTPQHTGDQNEPNDA